MEIRFFLFFFFCNRIWWWLEILRHLEKWGKSSWTFENTFLLRVKLYTMFYFNSNQISIVKENIYSIFFASVNIFFNYSFLASFHFGHLGFLTKNSQNLVRNKIVFYDVHEHESVLVKKKKRIHVVEYDCNIHGIWNGDIVPSILKLRNVLDRTIISIFSTSSKKVGKPLNTFLMNKIPLQLPFLFRTSSPGRDWTLAPHNYTMYQRIWKFLKINFIIRVIESRKLWPQRSPQVDRLFT